MNKKREVGYSDIKLNVYQDNQSVILVSTCNCGMAKSRTIRSRKKLIYDKYINGDFKIMYLPSELMVADIMTKPLIGSAFRSLANAVLGTPKIEMGER